MNDTFRTLMQARGTIPRLFFLGALVASCGGEPPSEGSFSFGARIFLGGDPMRMGAYGILDPMTAMHRMMPMPGGEGMEMHGGQGHERH